eukprot:CAMPEP_0172878528 /NCGR_PEP_ID=MMETSP1075-20121228/109959_1 /TAXON_ID=2916 /ORGANISM="Ceratium fusus, Strain PA161109" /LENGTH=113 /DNA_ID=CAMNT_0013730339 /DNA_START=44 /DNA_END=385 /DNA_ORIENTATION=-
MAACMMLLRTTMLPSKPQISSGNQPNLLFANLPVGNSQQGAARTVVQHCKPLTAGSAALSTRDALSAVANCFPVPQRMARYQVSVLAASGDALLFECTEDIYAIIKTYCEDEL